MIAASLFSGIGAPEQAIPSWRWAWHAEIDPFASAVLAHRHPQSGNIGDVSADDFCARAAAIARPDVLVFGSPCQSFSVAGRRLGLDDPRGNLALVALGIVARLRPRWFVFENVPGLLSSADGRDFGLLLRSVDDIGYSGAWAVLDAQHFGVAQRRRRVFFVGHAGDWRGPAAVLLEPARLRGDSPPRHRPGQAVASGLGAGSARSGGRVGRREAAGNQLITFDETQITSRENRCNPQSGDPSHPIAAGGRPPTIAFHGRQDPDCGLVTHPLDTDGGSIGVAYGFEDRWRGDDGRGHARGPSFSPEISATMSAMKPPSVAFGGNNTSGSIAVATAISAHGGPNGRCDFESETFLATASAVRRLTPRECERLQGFPDDYTLIPLPLAARQTRVRWAADGPRYRALGNSMAVPVVRWLLERVDAVDRLAIEGAE